MTTTDKDQVLDMLYRAQTLLLSQLHTPKLVSLELAVGLDKLLQANELIENPKAVQQICSECQNVIYGSKKGNDFQCLSCGERWNCDERL